MKRRSMLGRRSRRPVEPTTPTQQQNHYKQPSNYSERTPSREGPPSPFKTPANTSSLSFLATEDEAWSVFKTYNTKPSIKYPGIDNGTNSKRDPVPIAPQFKVPAQKALDKPKITKNVAVKQDHQDLRAVSPPWSYSSGNLSTKMYSNSTSTALNEKSLRIPAITVTSENVITKMVTRSTSNEMNENRTSRSNSSVLGDASIGYQSASYQTSYAETQSNECANFSYSLGDVALGVNSLDLFNKHSVHAKVKMMHDKSKPPAYKLQLNQVIEEELPSSGDELKENIPPQDRQRTPESAISSSPAYNQPSNDEPLFEMNPPNKINQLRQRIDHLRNRIDVIDDEKRALENEMHLAYVEILELSESNSTASMPSRGRRKLSLKKNRPSFVASKLCQKEMKQVTPIQISKGTSQSKFASLVYTPKSLCKSLNEQHNSIFDY